MTWIKMVALEVNNLLHLKYMLNVDSIGLGRRINREMRGKVASKVWL